MAGIAVPLLPDKVDDWKAWAQEVMGPRREEFDAFNERMGLTEHRVWLFHGDEGPMAVVVHGGPGEDAFMERLGSSDHPFDTWFREKISEFHGVDFSKPPEGPPPESVMDWRA